MAGLALVVLSLKSQLRYADSDQRHPASSTGAALSLISGAGTLERRKKLCCVWKLHLESRKHSKYGLKAVRD